MAIVLLPGYRITDANGTPVNGGKLYVFEAGTSNPRDVYTEETLTTAHAHPVVADSGGLLPDIYSAEDELKLRVTDASDVTIWEIDNYTAGSTGSSSGSASREILSKVANYTVAAEDNGKIIAMDASGIGGLQGDVTAGSATLGAGFLIGVKNVGATGNTLIQGSGSETIDGAANRLLTTQYEFLDMASRGAAGWFVLASQGTSETSVTIQQPDASTDGEVNFENELGTRRWAIAHDHSSDELIARRYDSSGVYVDDVFTLFDGSGGANVKNDLTVEGDLKFTPRVLLIETVTTTSGTTATSATIDFATLYAAGYRDLVLSLSGVSGTDGTGDFAVDVSDDDGTGWSTTTQAGISVQHNVSGGGLEYSSGRTIGVDVPSGNSLTGFIFIENFAETDTDFPKRATPGGSFGTRSIGGVGAFIGFAAIDKIRLRVTVGNFDAGSYKLYARM